jgi:hypothetical protein
MNSQPFKLQPFPAHVTVPEIEITGRVDRNAQTLSIQYWMQGDLAELEIPPPTNRPSRQDQLWEYTCLEFFLAFPETPQYWEFNLSPAGDWNVYCFADYRQEMAPELAFTSLPFQVQTHPACLELSLTLDLSSIAEASQSFNLAISAVTQSKSGLLTYWALKHPKTKADFHDRACFILEI